MLKVLRSPIPGMAILIAFVAGCEKDGMNPIDVSGKVTWKGEPVDGGKIRFFPIPATAGPVTGSHIVKGQYAAVGHGAVPPGNYRVEITWIHELPIPAGADDAATPTEEAIPAKYNTESELTLEVPPNAKTLTHNFDLLP